MQQHDVKVLGLRNAPQLIELGLRVNAFVERCHLAHQVIAVARQAFQCFTQHRWRLVGLSRLEEADAAVIRVAHQPCELLLPQGGLHRTAVRPGSEGQLRHLHL